MRGRCAHDYRARRQDDATTRSRGHAAVSNTAALKATLGHIDELTPSVMRETYRIAISCVRGTETEQQPSTRLQRGSESKTTREARDPARLCGCSVVGTTDPPPAVCMLYRHWSTRHQQSKCSARSAITGRMHDPFATDCHDDRYYIPLIRF